MKASPLQLEVLRQLDRADGAMTSKSFSFRGVPIPSASVDRMVARGLLTRKAWTPGAGPQPVEFSALGRAALDAGDDPTRMVPLAPTGPLSVFSAHPSLEFEP